MTEPDLPGVPSGPAAAGGALSTAPAPLAVGEAQPQAPPVLSNVQAGATETPGEAPQGWPHPPGPSEQLSGGPAEAQGQDEQLAVPGGAADGPEPDDARTGGEPQPPRVTAKRSARAAPAEKSQAAKPARSGKRKAPSGGDAGLSGPGGDSEAVPLGEGLPAEHELPLYDQYAPRRSKRAVIAPTGRKASTTNLAAAGGEEEEFEEEEEDGGARPAKKPAARGRGAKKQPAGRGGPKAGAARGAAKGAKAARGGDTSDVDEYDSQASSEGEEESSDASEGEEGDGGDGGTAGGGGTFATDGGTETGTEVGLVPPEALQMEDYVPVDRVLGMRVAADGSTREYCIKIVDRSFRDLVWRTHEWLVACAPGKLRGFRCRTAREGLADEGEAAGPEGGVFYPTTDVATAGVVPAGTFFPASYLVIDRVIAVRSTKASASAAPAVEYLCKWTGLGYSHATWEAAETLGSPADRVAVERYHYISRPRGPVHRTLWRVPPQRQLVTPPAFKPGCELRDYQRVSFDWMARNQRTKRNVILGDEMGLGKTAQSVSILEHLRTVGATPGGPFLVVAPLTTLTHWQREVHKWTHMNAVIYDGSAADKAACFKWDFYTDEAKPARPGAKLRPWPTGTHPFKFDCLLITYDTLRKEAPVLGTIDWQAMVLDEAHRLKDVNSATSVALRTQYWPEAWMLMLTGTPVQNNLSELFGLLHLLDRVNFPSLPDFEERFCPGGVVEASRMPALAAALKPYLLRRMKEDVENIPEKEECVVWVEMTADQRAYYKALHESKMHVLLAANSRKNMPNSRNLLMELRHCCNHPFLLTGIQDDFTRRRMEAAAAAVPPQQPPGPVELLVSASGKMVLLAKLLPKLKTDGHKVLIFSQFKMVLNLLQDLCHAMGWPAERLDGDTTAAERQAGIDRFNDPEGGGFVYLLSTRAGGMGITLTAADTAIIYDSDWNPQQDLQAMARCHRIGQTKSVRVYRLVTRGTYEEAILKAASRKFGLDEALLGAPGDADGAAGGPDPLADVARIESLLKHGVGAFSEAAVAETQRFVAEGIEDILDKRVERRQVGSRKGNTFSTATFVAEEDGAAGGMVPDDALLGDGGAASTGAGAAGGPSTGAEFWASFLPDAVAREVADPHSKRKFVLDGPRQRKRVDYSIKALAATGREEDYDLGDESDSDSALAGGAARTPSWTPTQVLNLETFLVSFGFGSREAAVALFQRSATVIPKEEAEEVATALEEMLTSAVHHVTGGTSDAVATAKAAAAEEEKEKAAAAAATAEGAGPKPLEEEDVDAELHAKLEAVTKPACARKALSSRRVTLRMQRNGARYGLRLAERAALLSRVCPDGSTELTEFDVPTCGRAQAPAPWWGIQEDRDLMRGSLRHGFTPNSPDLWKAQHRAIRLDPDLCFGAILARLDEQDKARKAEEAAQLALLVGSNPAAAAAAAEGGAPAAPQPGGLPTATPAMPPGFDDDDGAPAPVAAPPPKQHRAPPPPPPQPEPEATPPGDAPPGDDGDAEMRGGGEDGDGEREGGEGAPRSGRPAVRGPLALGSTRCGSCKSCLNPKLKQACFTRRREEGGMLPSGAGSTRGPPQPGEQFWPLGAVLKRRLQKLLEGLLRPANTEPRPPRKRQRPAGAAAAARKPEGGEAREGEEGEEDDEIEEDEEMGDAGASPQAPQPPATAGKKKKGAKEAEGGAAAASAPAPTPPKGRKRGRSASPGARPAAAEAGQSKGKQQRTEKAEAAKQQQQQQQPAGMKQGTLPFVIPKKQA